MKPVEHPFYEFIKSKITDENWFGLHITQYNYSALLKEIGGTEFLSNDKRGVIINGREIYLCWGCNGGMDRFYKRIGNDQIYLYPMDINLKPMKELATQSNINAVGIEVMQKRFTNGQLLLLHTLNAKMETKEPFTIEDARYIFAKTMKRGPQTYVESNGSSWDTKVAANGIELIKHKPEYFDYSMKTWLKLNLGALMMKGALVAVPVIKLGEDALIGLD